MKNIIYALVILAFFAGCKKTEHDPQVRFSKVKIIPTGSGGDLMIRYEGKSYKLTQDFGMSIGENKLQLLNVATGQILVDTTLNIVGPDTFKLTELEGAPNHKMVLIRSPLSGETAAPYGYMKIKIANRAVNALPYPKIDIVFRYLNAVNGIYAPVDTIKGVGTDYNAAAFLVRRILTNGVVSEQFQQYRFSFINSATGAPVKNASGDLFTEITFSPESTDDNLYVIDLIEYNDAIYPPNSIPQGNEFYDLEVLKLWNR